jgi:hypothetical protein
MTVRNVYMDPTDPATIGRLKAISLDDVEVSVRTRNALKKCGVSTLHDAQTAVSNGQLRLQHGVGRKTVNEVKEVIWYAMSRMPPPPAAVRHRDRLELNSLLLAYETHVLALYTYQRADVDNDRFKDIDLGASIFKRKASIERIREKILAFADKEQQV